MLNNMDSEGLEKCLLWLNPPANLAQNQNHTIGNLRPLFRRTLQYTGIGDSPYRFEGGDAEIVAEVRYEMAVACGEIIELDDSDSEDEGDMDGPSRHEVMELCERLEKVCFKFGSEKFSLELPRQLRKFRAQLLQEHLLNST
jgi:hypothetical protein